MTDKLCYFDYGLIPNLKCYIYIWKIYKYNIFLLYIYFFHLCQLIEYRHYSLLYFTLLSLFLLSSTHVENKRIILEAKK